MKFLIPFLLVLGLITCKTTQNIQEEPKAIINEIDSPPDAKILTVILDFKRFENPAKDEINLFKSILAPGYMKKADYELNQEDFYQCAFMKGNKEMTRFSFPDPLRKPMEFVGDDGKLKPSIVTSDKSALPLRMNHVEGVNKLKIYRKSGDKYKAMKTFKLEY